MDRASQALDDSSVKLRTGCQGASTGGGVAHMGGRFPADRAVLDALSSVVWIDDRQVARLVASKRWPDEGEAPGASIRVRRLAETR